MTEVLAGASVAGSLFGGINNAVQGNNAQSEAEAQIKATTQAEQKLIDDEKNRQAQQVEDQMLITERDAESAGLNKGGFNGNGTIMTGPLGIPTGIGSTSKTLLGE